MSHDSIRGYVRPLVRRYVGPLVRRSVMLLSTGRDEPANNLFRVYKLVTPDWPILDLNSSIPGKSFSYKFAQINHRLNILVKDYSSLSSFSLIWDQNRPMRATFLPT